MDGRKKLQARGLIQPKAAPNPDQPPPAPPPPKPLDAYYDQTTMKFFVAKANGEWVRSTKELLELRLRSNGYNRLSVGTNSLTLLENELMRIQLEMDVHFAGPLAGFDMGVYDVCGRRILVTNSPKIIRPERGKWETLARFLSDLLRNEEDYFHAWIKCALDARDSGPPFRPGQVLAIAGPAGCGKSLLQDVITEILGGRSEKPYRYLIGDSKFNAELLGAEHLLIEDEAASTDLRSRRAFGANLKNITVNQVQSYHQKNKTALSLTPFWRVSITLNEEPEHLMVLPPIDDSLKDKIFLLRARPSRFPFRADNLEARKKFRDKLSAELPAYLFYLDHWAIPQEFQDQRYGVRAFQDPELMAELDELAPEFKLLALIEGAKLDAGLGVVWEGSAAALEQELRRAYRGGEVDRLLSYANACGTYLARLAKKKPDVVESLRGENHTRKWRIHSDSQRKDDLT